MTAEELDAKLAEALAKPGALLLVHPDDWPEWKRMLGERGGKLGGTEPVPPGALPVHAAAAVPRGEIMVVVREQQRYPTLDEKGYPREERYTMEEKGWPPFWPYPPPVL